MIPSVNIQSYYIIDYIPYAILSTLVTYFLTESLYFFIPFTFCPVTPPSAPMATTSWFSIFVSLLLNVYLETIITGVIKTKSKLHQ